MLTLTGMLFNIYESPKGVSKTTGKEYGGANRIQLICQSLLNNGDIKAELIDLSVDDLTPYKGNENKTISVPVGVYVSNNKPAFFALKKA